MRHWLAVTALCSAFFLQCYFAARRKSPTNDEPLHIVAGMSYVATRSIVANPQHPPLLKELAGLSLAASGVHFRLPAGVKMENLPKGWDIAAGKDLLNNSAVARTLFRARLPLLFLSPLLALAVYWWGRELGGPGAGLGALFLLAADPTMVAHSYLVTTDAGVATFSLLFLLALYRYLRVPTTSRLVTAGIALGVALCTKFSAIFLPLIAVELLAAGVWWPPAPSGKHRPRNMVSAVYELAVLGAISLVVIQLCYFSIRGPLLYVHGLTLVNADHDPQFLYYLGGQLKHRFFSYFAAAWLLKEPLATIALAIAGSVLVWRSRAIPRLAKLFLFFPPAVFFLACTLWADDIGIRYEMPAMAFGLVAGGLALQELWKHRVWGRAVALVACGWIAVPAAGIYPDHLSYFNEAACLFTHPARLGFDGGSRCGADWLADSNVDWGQGLPQLKAWLDQNAPGRTIRFQGFNNVAPAAYGIPAESAEPYLAAVPEPGLYVISAHLVAYLPLFHDLPWLRAEPDAIVGHAFYVYEF
jgi:hypothetical protein